MRSMTLHEPSLFPKTLRDNLEEICSSQDVKRACVDHTKSPGSKLLDRFFKKCLSTKGFSIQSERLLVAPNCKFDLDLLVSERSWTAGILIEGGQAARIDLDLMKFIAWSKNIALSPSCYGVLIASDKKLFRTITGTQNETAFDYLRRLRPLFIGTGSNITDLLILEFET